MAGLMTYTHVSTLADSSAPINRAWRSGLLLLLLSVSLFGCTSTSREQEKPLAKALSCKEILNDEHFRDARHHRSDRYHELVERYTKNSCPAPEFHKARQFAVDQLNISKLSEEDQKLSCYDAVVTKTRVDELFEWYSTSQGELSGLNVFSDEEARYGMQQEQIKSLPTRKHGLDSLYRVNECDTVLTIEQKMAAKEVFRAVIRDARRRYIKNASETSRRSAFNEIRDEERALSCSGLLEKIREEEDNRVYHHGTYSRTIVSGGFFNTTLFASLFGGPAAALLAAALVDAQSFSIIKRISKKEGRLLELFNKKSCYEPAAVPAV